MICRGFRGFIMVGRDAASKKTPGISGISNSEPRAELALEVEVEGEDRCARFKKSWNPTRTMRLIIFSQPSVFIRGHLHAQLVTLSKRAITNTGFARLISKRLSCGESSLKSLTNSDQAVIFLLASSEQMLAFALFSFSWRIDLRSFLLNTKHYILSEQRGRGMSVLSQPVSIDEPRDA